MKVTRHADILYCLIEKAFQMKAIVPGAGGPRMYVDVRKVLQYISVANKETFPYTRARDFYRDLDAFAPWKAYRLPDRKVVASICPNILRKALEFDVSAKACRNSTRQTDMDHYCTYPTMERSWIAERGSIVEYESTIPPIERIIDGKKCVALVTAPGLGKTNAIVEYIKTLNSNACILVISFRVALSRKQHEDLKDYDFTHYADVEEGLLRLQNIRRLIVQVDSVLRVTTKVKELILVIDEWESLTEHVLLSPYIFDRREVVSSVVNLVKQSKTFIIADANYSRGSDDFLRHICGLQPAIYFNSYIRNVRLAQFLAGRGQLADIIIVLLRKWEKLFVPTNSKRFAKYLIDRIEKDDRLQAKRGKSKFYKLYCNDTELAEGDPIHDMIKYDCCIVTPKFQAGNSFVAEHFDRVCGFFSAASCSPEASAQLLMRVRNLKNKVNFFVVDNRLGGRKTVLPHVNSVEGMVDYLVEKGGLFSREHQYLSSRRILNNVRLSQCSENLDLNDPTNYLAIACAVNLNEGHKNYAKRFISLLDSMGYRFNKFVSDDDKASKQVNIKAAQDIAVLVKREGEELIQDIAQAPVITSAEVAIILSKMENPSAVTAEEKLQLRKYRLLSLFTLPNPYDVTLISEAMKLRYKKQLMLNLIPIVCIYDEVEEKRALARTLGAMSKCPSGATPTIQHFYHLSKPQQGLILMYLLSFVRALGFDHFFDPKERDIVLDNLLTFIQSQDRRKIIEGLFGKKFTDRQLTPQGIIAWLNKRLTVLGVSVKRKNNKGTNRVSYLESPWRLSLIGEDVTVLCNKIETNIPDEQYLQSYPILIEKLTKDAERQRQEDTESLMSMLSRKCN